MSKYKVGLAKKLCLLALILVLLSMGILSGCASQQVENPALLDSESLVSAAQSSGTSEASEEPENKSASAQSFLFFACTQAHPATGDYAPLEALFESAVRKAGTPELVLFGGDVINNGWNPYEWQDFWQAVATPLYGLTTAAAAGNHDSHPLFAEQFDFPDTTPATQDEGFFYSLSTEFVHFLMLDSNIMGAANARDIQWLRDELHSEAAQQAAWRIAIMHHPMWTVVDNPRDARRAETMREHFLPILEAYGVDIILCGHQHVYARTMPMQGDEAADSGIVQIMVATGGKDTYTPGQRDYLAVYHRLRSYLVLTANSDELIIEAFDESHNRIDTLILTNMDD
ncbi:MAG: metallophosphoesterase [Oscillospiraceae bacterium]|nr:metallophosphoesterase [Oscillospiraceae bacterium]